MNQSISWSSQQHQEEGVHLYFFLYLYSKTAVIVLHDDVNNCICVSLCVYHRVCAWECNCLLNLFMFNLSGSLSKKMNNLLFRFQPGWAVWTSFLAHTYLLNFLPVFPLSILPSFPLLHTLSFEVNIFAGHLKWSVKEKSKQVLSKGQVLEIHLDDLFSFQLLMSWFILKGNKID